MSQNNYLATTLANTGFAGYTEFSGIPAYNPGMIVVADRWYPSSKTCSGCGHKLEALPLAVRGWACPACGSVHDRDVNAAINLKNLAVRSTVSACGEEGSGIGCSPCGLHRVLKTKPASAKQESSSKATYGWLRVGMEERSRSLCTGGIPSRP